MRNLIRHLLYFTASTWLTQLPAESDLTTAEVVELEPFIIESYGRVDDFAVVSVEYVDEADLQRLAQATLGETLSWVPGVSASYFAPGASRPVIRGLEGFRIRMLRDDIGTLDVSESSPDHGVALEPLLVREVDIHRGPSALLYGSAAIGGAVNSASRVLPETPPPRTMVGSQEVRFDSASQGFSGAAYSQATAEGVVIALAGSVRDSDDYEINGNARTAAYDATFNPIVNDPVAGVAVPIENPSGRLPNTFHESRSWSAGLAWLPESLPIGLNGAYSRYDSTYGVPYQFPGDSADLFGDTSLDLRHERFDLEARTELDHPALMGLDAHFGYADYRHVELFNGRAKDADKAFEDVVYDQHALEARLDWYLQPFDWWRAVAGVNGLRTVRENSFLARPPREETRIPYWFETDSLGWFLLQTFTVEELTLQVGGRYEWQSIARDDFGIITTQRDYGSSAAASLTWRRQSEGLLRNFAVTPSLSYVERLPSSTERYAFWPNPAINRFLIGGDRDGVPLAKERSLGGELGVEIQLGQFGGRFNGYYYEYDNFIFLQDQFGLQNPARYVEKDATFWGYEGELSWLQPLLGGASLKVSAMSDYVRGHNETDDQPLPRMPPLRIGSRLDLNWRGFDAGFEARYAFAQDRVQPQTETVLPELETDAYTELNADFAYTLRVGSTEATAFLRASNLLDEERRVHTSFLKDVAPLPGRSFSLGMRLSY